MDNRVVSVRTGGKSKNGNNFWHSCYSKPISNFICFPQTAKNKLLVKTKTSHKLRIKANHELDERFVVITCITEKVQ